MVLEKSLKLTTRNVFDAAADVSGIPDRTPGQMLLQALTERRLNADRGESWATKLRKLPALEVKHPPKSDATIFGLPHAETRGLLQRAIIAKANMEGVYNMLLSRENRHEAAWGGFLRMKQANKQSYEEDLNSTLRKFKKDLGDLDNTIAEIMRVLEDHLLMKLELREVEDVWTKTAERLPVSAELVDRLEALLAEVEKRRKEATDVALYTMIMTMNDVAHIDPQQVARIVESESMELNRQIISNKRAYADLLRRLRNAEVDKEAERRQRWEAAMKRWRIVRTQQLMDEYESRIRSPEFAEPPERLAMFGNLRSRQQQSLSAILRHTETARAMVPPAIEPGLAEEWRVSAARLISGWYRELDAGIAGLQQHEEGIQELAQDLYRAVEERCVELQGYPVEELKPMLEAQCLAAAAERRQAAVKLLHDSDKYLLVQAQGWHRSVRAVSLFLRHLAMLYENHKINFQNNDDSVHSHLGTTRNQFNDQDGVLEGNFSAAVVAVQQGYSEKNLDQRVDQALTCLNLIEQNYRDFHATMVAIAQKHPKTVKDENDAYEVLVCTHLGLKPRCQKPLTEEETRAAQQAARAAQEAAQMRAAKEEARRRAEEEEAKAAKGKGSKKAAKAPEPEPEPEAEPEEEIEPEAEPEPIGPPLVTSAGTEFPTMKDLYDDIHAFQASQWPGDLGSELRELQEMTQAEDSEQAVTERGDDEAHMQPNRTEELQSLRNGFPPGYTEEPEGEAGDRTEPSAAREGAPAAQDNSKQEGDEFPRPPDSAGPPLTQGGDRCLAELEIPKDQVESILHQIRVEIIEEMEAFADRTDGEAKEWSATEVEEVTEELDENLRKHRPRAGRIEEDVRLKRSIELIGQRRKMETHIKALNTAIRREIETYKDAFRELKDHYHAQVGRIAQAERLLGTALSVKSLEIRKREAVSMRTVIDKDTEARAAELIAQTEANCLMLKGLNSRFDRDALKGFEEGGRFAGETLAKFREQLRYYDLIVEEKLSEQKQEIEDLRTKQLSDANDALMSLKRKMPAHRQDLTLIEAIDKSINAARKRADKCFEASNSTEATVNSCIVSLDQITAAACEHKLHANMSWLETCQEILRQAEELRRALVSRGHGLRWIKSEGIKSCTLQFEVKAAGQVDPNKAGEEEAASSGDKKKDASKDDKKRDAKKDKKNHAKKGGDGGGGSAVHLTEVGRAETIESAIEAEIAKCQAECDAAVDEYYAAKNPEREITRPNRIPAEAEKLKTANAKVLTEIREQTATFVEAARKELRIQVINAYRLLTRVPGACSAALTAHELEHAQRAIATLDGPYEEAHRQFQAEQQQHKGDLRPSLRDPNRVGELQALRDKEEARRASSKTRIKQHARLKVTRVTEQVGAIEARLQHLLQVLLGLFDKYLHPEDLENVPEGDESIRAVAPKNVKQLQRLHLAQEEAPTGNSAAEPGRPQSRASWTLKGIDRRAEALGWAQDQWTLVDLPEEDAQGFERPQDVEPEEKEVQGLDTPAHRHSIRAYRASMQRVQAKMKAVVSGCRETTRERLSGEDRWASNWETLLAQMDV